MRQRVDGADDEDDDDALTWVDHLGDQSGFTAFAFLRESARTQERPRRHCISPWSALARKHTHMYVHSRRDTNTRTHTYAHLTRALGSSVEATNTLQRINRITAPPSIRSPPFCHDDMYVCITRFSLRNNTAMLILNRHRESSSARITERETRKHTPKYKTNRRLPMLLWGNGLKKCSFDKLRPLYLCIIDFLPIIFFFCYPSNSCSPFSF